MISALTEEQADQNAENSTESRRKQENYAS